ncbi:hypothetical protein AAMO2058_001493800 [Amorphochlora amoebiformis]
MANPTSSQSDVNKTKSEKFPKRNRKGKGKDGKPTKPKKLKISSKKRPSLPPSQPTESKNTPTSPSEGKKKKKKRQRPELGNKYESSHSLTKKPKKLKKAKKKSEPKSESKLKRKQSERKRDKKAGIRGGNTKPAVSKGVGAKRKKENGREKIKKKKKRKREIKRGVALPPHKLVLAPMVGGSELAFRMLCRRYGTELCYTPMMYSKRFVEDPSYRKEVFHTHPDDRPLVAHFCGNDPEILVSACKLIQDRVDAVDLNLGCPQRVAFSGHFGSYLLDKADHPLVLSIVKRMSESLSIPVFAKIRLLDHLQDTIDFCMGLERSGCRLIAVHARYRGTATRRRHGPAYLDQVAEIKKHLKIPVISNGNVRCWKDVEANFKQTNADGIMSAEGLLDSPDLFSKYLLNTTDRDTQRHSQDTRQHIQDMTQNSEQNQNSGPQTHPHPNPDEIKSKLPPNVYKQWRKMHKLVREIIRICSVCKSDLNANQIHKIKRRAELQKEIDRLEALHPPLLQLKPKKHTKTVENVNSTYSVDNNRRFKSHELGRVEKCKDPILKSVYIAKDYLEMVNRYPSSTQNELVFHIRRMCKKALEKYQLMDQLKSSKHHKEVAQIIDECLRYAEGRQGFKFDSEKAKRQAEAVKQRIFEDKCRKKYIKRMERKAKRLGKRLEDVLKPSSVPGGHVYGADPSWLAENTG